MSISQISIDQLPADAVILDVREQDEWDAGHVDGATHIPMAEVPQRLGEIPEGDPVYVMCRSGGRSARVTEWLVNNGLEAVNVDGGMLGWQSAGKPMATGNSSQPTVI